jgi:signal transduction histidine kinase/outer membrane protein assembly factor BamB
LQRSGTESDSLRVFGPREIGNSSEIYSAAVDVDGRVYAATPDEEAIYCFDGAKWKKHTTEIVALNFSTDPQGRVWCGSEGTIFQVAIDSFGNLDKSAPSFEMPMEGGQFFGVETPNGVVFQSHKTVVKIIDGAVEILENKTPHSICYADEDTVLAIGKTGRGLYEIEDGAALAVKGLEDGELVIAVRIGNDQILASLASGEIVVAENGTLRPFSKKLIDAIDGGDVYYLMQSRNSRILVGTTNGFFECSMDGTLLRERNKRSSLPDDFVYRAVAPRDSKDVWLVTGSSLSCLFETHGIMQTSLENSELNGAFLARSDGEFVICSDEGCMFLDEANPLDQQKVQGIKSDAMVWAFAESDRAKLIATTRGVFEIKGRQATSISTQPVRNLVAIDENLFLASSDLHRFLFFEHQTTGEWQSTVGPILPYEIAHIQKISGTEYLAVGLQPENLSVFTLDVANKTADFKPVSTGGLDWFKPYGNVNTKANEHETKFFTRNGIANLASSENGYCLVLEESADSSAVKEILKCRDTIEICQVANNQFLSGHSNSVELLTWNIDHLEISGIWISPEILPGSFLLDKDRRRLSFVSANSLTSVDFSAPSPPDQLKSPILNFSARPVGGTSDEKTQMLPPLAGAKFEFAAPFGYVPRKQIRYQFRLVGQDNDWSSWNVESRKEYTNLPGGEYEFQIQARARNLVSPVRSCYFSVAYPWYKKSWAIALFSCLFFGTFLTTVSVWSRQLRLRNLKMKQLVEARTQELYKKNQLISQQSLELQRTTQKAEAERLESLNRMLGGLAHDFNNLLQSISLNGELLCNSNADSLRIADAIQSAVSTGRGLSTQLKALSGNIPICPEFIDLNHLVEGMTSLIETVSSDRIAVEISLSESSLPTIGDVSELQRALLNLVSNAKEAARSVVRVETGRGHFSTEDLEAARFQGPKPDSGDYVWIEVSDDGRGPNKKTAKNLFDPFFSTKGHGRGLGLAIVMGAVGRHHGMMFISVDQTPNSGFTRFRVCFPLAADTSQTPKPKQLETLQQQTKNRRVLIVDDEELLRDTLKIALECCQFDVTACENAKVALEIVEQGHEFDVALIDQLMPGMRGEELAKQLIATRHELSVFLMSGYSDKEIDKEILSRENVQFLQKPFSMKGLAKKLSARSI